MSGLTILKSKMISHPTQEANGTSSEVVLTSFGTCQKTKP